MSYLVRCKASIKSGPLKGQQCNARHQLKRHPKDYIRKPKCKSCGAELRYVDKWQMKKNKENLCYCDALPNSAPHRAGSTVWCTQHPTGPTEEDYIQRYGPR
jgi:hypothetical protein